MFKLEPLKNPRYCSNTVQRTSKSSPQRRCTGLSHQYQWFHVQQLRACGVTIQTAWLQFKLVQQRISRIVATVRLANDSGAAEWDVAAAVAGVIITQRGAGTKGQHLWTSTLRIHAHHCVKLVLEIRQCHLTVVFNRALTWTSWMSGCNFNILSEYYVYLTSWMSGCNCNVLSECCVYLNILDVRLKLKHSV